MPLYKDFPEFEKTVPEVITFTDTYLDEQWEKEKRLKNKPWKVRKEGRLAGKTKTKPGWYPPEKRIQIATAFVAGMTNASDLERLSGVSASAIRNWKQKDWWRDLIERVRHEQDEAMDPKFTKIVDKTLDVIADRLESGDYKMDRHGELHRVPVSLRDAVHASEKIIDKRNLLRGKPTSRVERLSEKEQLNKLAAEFRKFAGAKQIEGEVIASDSGTTDTAVTVEGREEREVSGVRDLEQAGHFEGPEADYEGEDAELHDSSGEGEGQSLEGQRESQDSLQI